MCIDLHFSWLLKECGQRNTVRNIVRRIVGYFGSSQSFGSAPGRPKVVSIKIFTVSRDRFGLPDRNFSIQAIAVVPVFAVFLDRPQSSL